jgi:hypothetical protein
MNAPSPEFPLDPALQRLSITPVPTSTSLSSTTNASELEDEDEDEDQDEDKDQQKSDGRAGAGSVVAENQSSKTKMVGKKRLTSDEVVYQTDKRKRETYYRNNSICLKEGLRKLGVYSGCYGILYIRRDILLYQSFNLLYRNVNDDSKAKETPVVLTDAIHDTPAFKLAVTESMGKIVEFEKKYRESQQQR